MVVKSIENNLFSIEHCYFENNINSSSNENFYLNSDVDLSPNYSSSISTDPSAGPTLSFFECGTELEYRVSDNSLTNVFPCGDVGKECNSIINALLSSCLYLSEVEASINIFNGNYFEEPLLIIFNKKKFIGESKEATIITYSPTNFSPYGLFSINYSGKVFVNNLTIEHSRLGTLETNVLINWGTLEVNNCEIKMTGSGDYYGALFVLLPGSSTIIINVEIHDFIFNHSSVIEANNTLYLNISYCIFGNISKKSGCGGVIQANLIDETKFYVINSTFSNCSTAVDGGCIYLYLDDDFSSYFQFSGSLVKFEDPLSAERGKAVFINAFCKELQV